MSTESVSNDNRVDDAGDDIKGLDEVQEDVILRFKSQEEEEEGFPVDKNTAMMSELVRTM